MTQLTRQNDSAAVLSPALGRPALVARLADYLALTKLRITTMVVITAAIGFLMGLASGAFPWLTLAGALVGTALSCMGASVLNQAYERDTDGMMLRTKTRPLPAGRVTTVEAVLLGLTLSAVGVALLWWLTNPLAALCSAGTIVSYCLVYTPLKRVTPLSTIIGAVPGAMPPVIGYAAATGRLAWPAAALFGILFLWQLPHFYAIAWLYRDDYARAKLPVLPVIDRDGRRTSVEILIGCLALLPVGLAPTLMGMTGWVYFAGALLAGLGFLAFGVRLVKLRTRAAARALFFVSLVYLPLVYTLMVVDRA